MGSKKIDGAVRVDQYMAERPDVIQIIPGFNARQELPNLASLKESISKVGIKDALWVRPDPANKEQPFILIDGERRLTVLRQLYMECLERGDKWEMRIPLQIYSVDAEQAEELMALALLEREAPSPADEATLVARWLERGYSVAEIAVKLNMSESWVEQRQLFSTVDPKAKAAVASGTMTFDTALDLARKVPSAQQSAVLDDVMKEAQGKRAQARKAMAARTGTILRPGKKDMKATAQEVEGAAVNGLRIPAKKAQKLVVDALKYGTGQMTKEAFIQACNETLLG